MLTFPLDLKQLRIQTERRGLAQVPQFATRIIISSQGRGSNSEVYNVSTSYNNMAYVFEAKKDLPKAKEYWEKAYAIRLKKMGPDHPNTKATKARLDELKKLIGR